MLIRILLVLLAITTIARGATDPPKPKLGLFIKQSDIARARERTQKLPWAKQYRERTLKIADEWVGRSDEWIRDILPKPGSKFSYGVAGCPKCGKDWGRFGLLVASFDRPLKLICPDCKTEFDLEHPAEPYADSGDGIVVNGRRFWLRGVWNAFVVDQMWSGFSADNAAIVNLADAYSLTGDERYAKKAIVIMDALATLSPQTKGPQDFATNPNGDEGRLQHLTSIFFRAVVHFARALDLVGRHDDLLKPSPTNPSRGSAWDNIRYGIFEEYLFVPIDVPRRQAPHAAQPRGRQRPRDAAPRPDVRRRRARAVGGRRDAGVPRQHDRPRRDVLRNEPHVCRLHAQRLHRPGRDARAL
jgi:hypothetical protein